MNFEHLNVLRKPVLFHMSLLYRVSGEANIYKLVFIKRSQHINIHDLNTFSSIIMKIILNHYRNFINHNNNFSSDI